MNFDSWDFIIAHKGNDKVESIDLQFIDLDKLNNIRKTQTSADPNGYSVFLHLDQMYPKEKGSLFAKQFIWKPFSLEHGHYTVYISTSTGRFHEELYIEKVVDKWKYAAKVEDIDTKKSGLPVEINFFQSRWLQILRRIKNAGRRWFSDSGLNRVVATPCSVSILRKRRLLEGNLEERDIPRATC